MTSYLPHDIQSLLPRSSPQTASLPSVGEAAPAFPSSSDIKVVQGGSGGQDINFATPSKGTLVAFVRHCGCPFAEKEIKLLSQVDKQYGGQGEVQIVVVQHSDEEETKKWWERIGGATSLPHAILIADPQRTLYSSFGVGTLGWGGLFSRSMLKELTDLKNNEGIVNTTTGAGSWRWQNSGGFAVDREGKVRWVKVAKDAGDVCPYDGEAVKSLL